jgi:hypothetical protein
MIYTAGQIIPEAFIEILRLDHDVSDVDAAVITAEKPLTLITQAGSAETRTLANGREGQVKILINTVYAADTVVAATLLSGTGITFSAAGQAWVGIFAAGVWHTIATALVTGDGGPVVG